MKNLKQKIIGGIVGLGMLAGCSGHQIEGLNGTSTKPYSEQIEKLHNMSIDYEEDNFRNRYLIKKSGNKYTILSCVPYSGFGEQNLENDAIRNGKFVYNKLIQEPKCSITQEGNVTSKKCVSSAVISGLKPTKSKVADLSGKKFYCVRLEER